MSNEDYNIVYLMIMILVPIIPSFILFKFLPKNNRAQANGPFHGLNIKLTGAFAGYIIIFAPLVGIIKPHLIPLHEAVPEPRVTYEISGIAEDKNGIPLSNVFINSFLLRNDTDTLMRKGRPTEQQGEYKFVYDSLRLTDEVHIFWEDPKGGDIIRRSFSPRSAKFNIGFKSIPL